MRKAKVLLMFLRLAILQKIAFYRNVILKMKDNPNFLTPNVSLAVAEASVDKLEAAYLASRDGSHTAIAERRKYEEETDNLFRQLADYVQRISKGDEAIILSAGFEVNKEPAPRKKQELTVELGDKPGYIELKRQAVPYAKTYVWQYCIGETPANEKDWTLAGITTQCTFELTGLTSGAHYWFRVAAVTPEGTGAFTSPVAKIPQ